MATSLTNLVSEHLYEQRIRQDSLSVEKLATTFAPLFQSAQADALQEALVSSGGEMGGRLMIIDEDGKVQFDSFSQLCGVRLQLPEVLSVLTGGQSTAYGIHHLTSQQRSLTADAADEYVAYCTASLIGTRGRLGVLLFVAPVQEMMTSLTQVQQQLLSVFLAVAVAALAVALIFSQVITKPMAAMTRTIQKMGKGDLSARVKVRGSGEIRQLAESYNTMAEQLERLDRSRNQFVSNASHELKTSLATMKILLESLIYQPDMPAELRAEFMQDMNHEIDRLTSIITDLLTLTQGDDHAVTLKLEKVDVSSLAEETLHRLQSTAEQRNLELYRNIQPGCIMQADSSKLSQIIYNLTENARKYTPDGGHISVRLHTESGHMILQVQDDGVGIPKDDQAHIFDRFYRVDKARSRDTGGTGLGLSIVRQMVTLHGGAISVDSQPGKGSVFTVRIPLTRKEGKA